MPMLEVLKNIYGTIDQLHLSVTSIVVAMVLLSLAMLFSIREAACWFFKIHDLKRDLRRLQEITGQLEGEIRALHSLIDHLKTQIPTAEAAAVLPSTDPKMEARTPLQRGKPSEKKERSGFSIVH